MARTGEKGHCSQLLLERHIYGVTSEAERAFALSHLASCGGCSDRLEAMKEMANLFQRRVLPRTLPLIHERVQVDGSGAGAAIIRRWAGALVPALALLVTAFVFVPQWLADNSKVTAPVTLTRNANRAKGDGLMRIYAKRQDAVFMVSDNEVMQEGDALRFVPDAQNYAWLLVFSQEAEGKLNVFYPYGSTTSGPLAVAPGAPLDGSIILDNAMGEERLWAVFSNRPLNMAAVASWLTLDGWLSNAAAGTLCDLNAAVFTTRIIKEGL